jgi:hypothetical protein
MDVNVHIDELVLDNGPDGPDREDAVAASLRPALGGVLDERALSDVGRRITETISRRSWEQPAQRDSSPSM